MSTPSMASTGGDHPVEETAHGLSDTKEREQFDTGMIREPNLMRGRYDLISPIALRHYALYLRKPANISICVSWTHEECIARYIQSAMQYMVRYLSGDRSDDWLCYTVDCCFRASEARDDENKEMMNYRNDYYAELSGHEGYMYCNIPTRALRRLAVHYERGGIKYHDRNWEKGGPLNRYFNSAFRHLQDFLTGNCNEDHLSACVWNCFCIIHTEELIRQGLMPESLDTMPCYTRR